VFIGSVFFPRPLVQLSSALREADVQYHSERSSYHCNLDYARNETARRVCGGLSDAAELASPGSI
jgi:hypothetical protein